MKSIQILSKKLFVVVFVLCIFALKPYAQQNNIVFESLSTLNGLSDNTINAITQDNSGFVWFATDNGLNRYDGYSITTYNHNPNSTNSLPSNMIKSICADKYGLLWIGSIDGGLTKYDPVKNIFTTYNFGSNNKETSSNDIFSIIEDRKGRLWIGTYGGGLNLAIRTHNSIKFVPFLHNPNDSNSISSNNIRTIKEMSNGDIWIGTEEGIINIIKNSPIANEKISFSHITTKTYSNTNFDGAIMSFLELSENTIIVGSWGAGLLQFKNNKQVFKNQNKLLSLGTIISTTFKDIHNNIWIGTWGNGLFLLDTTLKIQNIWNKSSIWKTKNISENKIWTIFQDKNGTLWVGTNEGGINRFNILIKKFNAISVATSANLSLSDNEVQAFEEIENGKILIATRSGGINIYDAKVSSITQMHLPIQNISIFDIHKSSNNSLWIGTDGQGLIHYNPTTKSITSYKHNVFDTNSLSNNAILSIHEDKNGNLWLGTWGGGFSKFNTKTRTFKNFKVSASNLSQNVIIDIDEDSQGNLWMASFGVGLVNYNPAKNKISFYKHEDLDKTSISSNILRQIFVDKSDNIWIGTNANGVDKYNVKLRKFEHFTESEGLFNTKIEGIIADTTGNIWISSNSGISMISENEINIYNYGIDDGLQANEFCNGALFLSKNGTMYAGGINGFNEFSPRSIFIDTIPPTVVLTDFKINTKSVTVGQIINDLTVLNESISTTKSITLSHTEKTISFEFSALDYIPNHKNKFAYKLEGFDEDWNYTTSNMRFAHYTNLDPGQYVFTVKASNSDDVWNKGVSIGLIIEPPFWQTWWFYTMSILLGIIFIYFFIKYRNRKLSQQKRELENEVSVRIKTIESQKSVLEHRLEELRIKSKELEEKNEEIQLQNEVVLSYVKEIETKREEVLQQKQEIIESIMYARRIQKALFPTKQYLDFILDDYFIYFKPRDIVSGDYYWVAEKEGKIIIVVADCTGHGVPGAFMSLLGISFLNEIINREISFKANEILNHVRSSVISSLNQTGQEDEAKDGMDMSLCIIDKEERIIQYAGANNPMYLFRKNGEFTMIQADKMPIGIFLGDELSFTCKLFEYEPGDTIYMFSDGYIDQFGGDKGRKFKSNRFKNLIAEMQDKPMRQQKILLNKVMNEWMSYPHPDGYNNFQVDDILVVGIRLT